MIITDEVLVKLLNDFAIPTAIDAGQECLRFHRKNFDIDYKPDNSPVTQADIAANDIICEKLAKTGYKILSEETAHASYSERKNWQTYWLIDPIDGTKEFVKGGNEFTVNIALIHENMPQLGVVYAPALSEIWYGYGKNYAFKAKINESLELINPEKLPCQNHKNIRIVATKSHMNEDISRFLVDMKNKFPDSEIAHIGSSLKLCYIADGNANIYVRFRPINEWDIGAGHAIVRAAGGKMIEIKTQKEIPYNTVNMKTPDFIASGNMTVLNKVMREIV
ncbi:MAG: 3'(2'),5'-bisphosphate nucleotidase CysQ [Bacteroidales bacterium]|nr:3'(2'),5'-bisphosphate nucleotidase CysQ [Bacteroidales bacterium]